MQTVNCTIADLEHIAFYYHETADLHTCTAVAALALVTSTNIIIYDDV
jgi:hypothetical protein